MIEKVTETANHASPAHAEIDIYPVEARGVVATRELVNDTDQPLSAELLNRMHAYWRAANYLSVGQIYLYDNALLREPLKLAHVKPLVVGTLGHHTRSEFHLCSSEPGYQEVRPRYVLHRGSGPRRPGTRR